MDLQQGVHGICFDATTDGVTDFVDDEGNVSRRQFIGDILRDNLFFQNQQKAGHRTEDMRRVASIPTAVIDIAMAQGIDLLHDTKALKAFLNDPSNRLFRTTLERV